MIRIKLGNAATGALDLDGEEQRAHRRLTHEGRGLFVAERDAWLALAEEYEDRGTSGGYDIGSAERAACRRAAAKIRKALTKEGT